MYVTINNKGRLTDMAFSGPTAISRRLKTDIRDRYSFIAKNVILRVKI